MQGKPLIGPPPLWFGEGEKLHYSEEGSVMVKGERGVPLCLVEDEQLNYYRGGDFCLDPPLSS